jgi:hypothetical protein
MVNITVHFMILLLLCSGSVNTVDVCSTDETEAPKENTDSCSARTNRETDSSATVKAICPLNYLQPHKSADDGR